MKFVRPLNRSRGFTIGTRFWNSGLDPGVSPYFVVAVRAGCQRLALSYVSTSLALRAKKRWRISRRGGQLALVRIGAKGIFERLESDKMSVCHSCLKLASNRSVNKQRYVRPLAPLRGRNLLPR